MVCFIVKVLVSFRFYIENKIMMIVISIIVILAVSADITIAIFGRQCCRWLKFIKAFYLNNTNMFLKSSYFYCSFQY